MSACEFYNNLGVPLDRWYCDECGTLWPNKESGDRCCDRRCEDCKDPLPSIKKYCWSVCNPCREAREDERELGRFTKAEKIHHQDWAGWVYYNDHYYSSTEDLFDSLFHYDDEETGRPDYVWACKTNKFVDQDFLGRVLSDIQDEAYEDFETDDLDGVPELKAALEAFVNINHTKVAYAVDYTKAILLGESPTHRPVEIIETNS